MAFHFSDVTVVCDICGHQLPPHHSENDARQDAHRRRWTIFDYAAVCAEDDPTHRAFADALTAFRDQ